MVPGIELAEICVVLMLLAEVVEKGREATLVVDEVAIVVLVVFCIIERTPGTVVELLGSELSEMRAALMLFVELVGEGRMMELVIDKVPIPALVIIGVVERVSETGLK